jgi:hypothetical protein
MRTKIHCAAVLALVVFDCALTAAAATTIDTTNRYAYAANLGWLDGVADTNNGAVIGEYVCSGYLYAANVGWISLGNGAPTNQIQYQNDSGTNFGVNQDGLGSLTGYAYGANIGWINFEQTYGKPKVDLLTGRLSGSVWSANCGWISLSNSVAYVQTDAIRQGALAPDGLPIAWLLQNFGTTNVNAGADPDGDGQSNLQEYLAGTDPNSAASVFQITYIAHGQPSPTFTTLVWNSLPGRFYAVQERPSLTATNWADYITIPVAGLGSIGFSDFNGTNEFFRVRAYRPLTP